MKSIYTLLCTSAMLAAGLRANASTLYATTSAGGSGELYIIDSTTGAMISDVGPLNDGIGINYPITGLAFNPTTGILYGSTGNANSATQARLVTINPATGLVTEIGSFNAGPTSSGGAPSTMADIAFDIAGNLYGIGSIGGPQVYSINITTGQATVIGSSGLSSTSGGGVAISTTGIAYGTPTSSRFGTYNLATGAFVNIANPTKPAGGSYAGLAFDENGTLFGINLGTGSPPPTHLVTIDPLTGVTTDLGASLNSIDAIAFEPVSVPEPTTLALLAGSMAAVGIGLFRRRS